MRESIYENATSEYLALIERIEGGNTPKISSGKCVEALAPAERGGKKYLINCRVFPGTRNGKKALKNVMSI